MANGLSTHIIRATFPSKIYVETLELNSAGTYFISVSGISVGFISIARSCDNYNYNCGYNNLYKGYIILDSMNLLQYLNRNKDKARKIFGEAELKIIEKQLLGLKLNQSEKNRLSRDIRKKLDFIKEISKYETEFGLKHGARIKELIEQAKEDIINSKYFAQIKKIILFGSTIERLRHLGSDVDIAVEFDDIDSKTAAEFRIRFNYDENLDIQVYNVLPDKIKKEIDKKGRVIYERKD